MSATLVVIPRQTPLNGGVTVPGAKLFVYDATLTTKRTIYTTSAMSVQLPNPVIADSNGRLPAIWVDSAGGDYKIVLAPAGDSDPPASAFWTDDNITHDVSDSQLSINVPLINAPNNAFSGTAYFGNGATNEFANTAHLALTRQGTANIVVRDTTNDVEALIQSSSGGVFLGSASAHSVILGVGNSTKVILDTAGGVTTNNTSASEVGFKGSPINTQDGDYTLVLADCGKTIYKSAGGAGETWTIPANASVSFPVGTVIRGVNNGGGALTLAITSDTLIHTAGTGSRTIADKAKFEIQKVATTIWALDGSGIT